MTQTVLQRAYTFLDVKEFNDEKRVIEGIASTPSPDRYQDIVDPLGAKFTLPMPLLWQHRHSEPVGSVEFAKPNKSGIPFRATLPIVEEAGRLRDRVEEAWHSVKYNLVRAVSIGFQPIRYSHLDTGGTHFHEWEWLELSLVTIPAQSEAVLTAIKSLDHSQLEAALGHMRAGSNGANVGPGVAGQQSKRASSGAIKLITRNRG